MIRLVIPGLKLVSEANARGHWSKKAARAQMQRAFVALEWRLVAAKTGPIVVSLPLVVTITRVAPRSLDAFDNLPRSMKAVVDELARLIGVDDKDPRVTWVAKQRKGKPHEYAVEIEIAEVAHV
jgi:hypothetical protein